MNHGISRNLWRSQHCTKKDYVVDALRVAIGRGDFAPGERLRQEDIARILEVSITPVREALNLLVREGLLQHEPHKGVTVVGLAREQIEEIYTLREHLECLVLELGIHRVTEERIAELQSNVERMAEAMREGRMDEVEMRNFDEQFHGQIARLPGFPRLVQMVTGLRSAFPQGIFLTTLRTAGTTLSQHISIVQAIVAGDKDAAIEAMRTHIRFSRDNMLGAAVRP